MAELSEEVTEIVEEAAEEVASAVGFDIHSRPELYIGAAAVVGAAIGAFVGYKLATKKLETKYNLLMDEEINKMREHFNAKEKAREERETALDEAMKGLGYKTETVAPDVIAPMVEIGKKMEAETRNLFDDASSDDVWDYADEVKGRDVNYPFIIHIDEHRENEDEYDQVTYTWFEGDDVMCDEHDNVVDLVNEKVGLHNLRFGHGSGDADTVYIRNTLLELDFEICRSRGSYAQEVHGFDPSDLQHSIQRRRSRYDDE